MRGWISSNQSAACFLRSAAPTEITQTMNDWTPQKRRAFFFGRFTLFPDRQMLMNGHDEVRIGGRAMDLLTALVERAGQPVSKRDLVALVWPNITVSESNLKVNIAALRRVIGDDSNATKYIATIAGGGYQFVAPVRSADGLDATSSFTSIATGPMSAVPASCLCWRRRSAPERTSRR